ncbi:hypothetical protein OEZ86_006735 [Tetradesmus obliquus]|nr:hypothetical protein OEZ86_006735 [Tetradesmus obliquus]
MHGSGRLTFPDGVCYEGSFAADSITGRGVYQWGNTIYEGEVQDGLRHGYGTLSFTDSPVVYEGQWLYGRRHGSGTLYYDAKKAAYYEGEWQDDMKHGQGSSVYPSGNSYNGSWVHDKREGPGTMTWASKGQTYSGMWADNMPNGLGEHVWQQGMPGLQMGNHATHVMHNR